MAGPARGQQREIKENPKGTPPATSRQAEVNGLLEEYDKNKDGFLQRDELPPRLRYNFDQIDTDKDGKLSREELQRGLVYLQPRRRPSDVVFVLIEMSDYDNECYSELQQMYDVLRKLDKNNNGKLDPKELNTTRQQLLEDRIDNFLKELDTDQDGRISRQEARGRLKENFDKVDTNKDGYVDRKELLRAAAERHAGNKSKEASAPNPNPEKSKNNK